MYSHDVYVVMYRTHAAENSTLPQKDVDRLNVYPLLYVLPYTISCRSTALRICSYSVPRSSILQSQQCIQLYY